MKVKIIFFALSSLCFVTCGNEHNDWNYYDEWSVNASIVDNSSYSIGFDLSDSLPADSIIEAEFDIDIDHDAPATLLICLIYNNDTIPIWTDNFPGGEQTFVPEEIIGRPVNAFYWIYVADAVPDGKEGTWNSAIIKINY